MLDQGSSVISNTPGWLDPVIGAAATILAAVIGRISFTAVVWPWKRKRAAVPEVAGSVWNATWSFANGDPDLRDEVTIEKWTRQLEFKGFGEITYDSTKYKYTIKGEVTTTRFMVLTYKGEGFPGGAPIGVACLQFDESAKKLQGAWTGRRSLKTREGHLAYTVLGGQLNMERIIKQP